MRIAVFGATGGTGQEVVRQALEQSHTVVALARAPGKLTASRPNLTVVQGNVLVPDDVHQTLTGAEAVIICLGNTPNNPSNVVSAGTQIIVDAMRAQSIHRIIVVTSLGVGDSKRQVPFVFRLLSMTMLRGVMADKEEQERIVKASGLDWTIVRPGGLTDGPPSPTYTAGVERTIKAGQVSRGTVAAFVLEQLTNSRYLHATPAIT